jgi:hypothetical protein
MASAVGPQASFETWDPVRRHGAARAATQHSSNEPAVNRRTHTMAPSIPTHRPVVTATRVAVSIAIAACASSVYLALSSAWAASGTPVDMAGGAACATTAAHADSHDKQASLPASKRGIE